MSTSTTNSIPPITIREGGGSGIIFTVKLPGGQPLSLVFTNPDIVAGLVSEYTTVEPVVVQRLGERNTLSVFAEGENIENLSQKL